METDVITFAQNIRDNTGIGLDVYSETGEFLFGEDKGGFSQNFEGVYADGANSRTLFKFRYKNKNYVGSVAGVNSASKNYAYLICELAEQSFAKSNLSKEEFFKSVLFGEASYYTIKKYARKYCRESKACVLLVSFDAAREEEVLNVISGYAEGSSDFACALEDGLCVLVKFSEEENGEYRSAAEYAEFLEQSVYEETGLKVGVYIGGTVENVADLSSSFNQAVAAHRMNAAVNNRVGVHSFKEFIMVKMLEDLPKYKLSEYLGMLLDPSAREIFDDKEMINTAEEFFENSLNVSETARKLYLHRNTLNYRLDKIEKTTGLNIRRIPDAITFRMITVILKLVR
ncbi:MAG: helix-turn-helix domain-containing protein [Clostridia bacterium]|nr:helix-turn-helix domain-containing protein [Clostridia bacterium]